MSEPRQERTRTVVWEDPLPAARAARGMSGLEYLRSLLRGDLPSPPIAHLLGFGLLEVAEGRAAFWAEPGEHHYNPIGMVHGGLVATLLDSALGSAIHTTLPAGTSYTTLELKVNFIRALGRDSPRVRCEGEVIHVGGRIATAQGRVRDESGTLYAHGTTTCLLLRPASAAPEAPPSQDRRER
jgi:uncharacterized protein (TIGR00369 family)